MNPDTPAEKFCSAGNCPDVTFYVVPCNDAAALTAEIARLEAARDVLSRRLLVLRAHRTAALLAAALRK